MVAVGGTLVQACGGLLVIGISLVVFSHFWKNRKFWAVARKFPPIMPTKPLLGHCYLFVYGLTGMFNIMMKQTKKFCENQSATMCVVWMGARPVFQIFQPKDIQIILEKEWEKPQEVDVYKVILGRGLIFSTGDISKIKRRYYTPLFHARNLVLLMDVINESGRDLTMSLSKHEGGGHVDVLEHTGPVSLKSSACLILGCEGKPDMESEIFKTFERAMERGDHMAHVRIMKIWLWPEFLFKLFCGGEVKSMQQAAFDFVEIHSKLIQKNREKRSKKCETVYEDTCNNISSDKKDGRFQTTLKDVFHDMKEAYSGFTDVDFIQEVISMLAAGTVTTKTTVASCFLALAANPQIQERLHAEITSVVGSKSSDITLEDFRDMPYLDQVLKETMRRFVIISVAPRKLSHDTKLSCCTLPAGSSIYIKLVGIHFNPKYYPEPEKFDPDRFSPENVAQREKYTYLPFGAGCRMCVGKSYSMMVMKTLIVHVLRAYELSTDYNIDNITYLPGIVYVSKEGYKIKLKRRHLN